MLSLDVPPEYPIFTFPVSVGVVCKTTAPVPVEEAIEIVGVAPPEDARGELAATEVTVPVVGVVQVKEVPLDVNT